ncbi:HD domain-containing protein [Candidatus Tisiphia endosymbiont of Nedyus quadrimaculatus]|uniref:HD domain-containing protein n=1 Tax=Candidatus Tisiphia endosymbiont of Nedyus quadrimaculatus TaxID=3139332 RepID=UPI00345F06B8
MEDINYWDNSRYQYCAYAERLLNELILLNTKVKQQIDIDEVKKGIYYAKKYHGNQMRQSGEPYYSHPIEVAYMVAQYTALKIPRYFRTDMIVTALLHDTIEDTKLTEPMIAYIFGSHVASQVQDLTRIKIDRKISEGETVNLLFSQYKKDVLHIKLFDRLHNLRTISAKSPEKIKKIIEETLAYFIPLAIYLELNKIIEELERSCLTALISNNLLNLDLFEDNSLLLSLGFQNDLTQMQNLKL